MGEEGISAEDYHSTTEHSRLGLPRGLRLGWSREPSPFKIYEGGERVSLPEDPQNPEGKALSVLEAMGVPSEAGEGPSDLKALARLLHFSCGLTAEVRYRGGTFYRRAVPSAGGLYPVELYLALPEGEGFGPGLYHFEPASFSLTLLRKGDPRGHIAKALGREEEYSSTPFLLLSSLFWRSAWKYRERAYRYCLMDAGHVAGNVLALGEEKGWAPELFAGFSDPLLNELLGLKIEREAALSAISLGKGAVPAREPLLGELIAREMTEEREDVFYESLSFHRASSMETPLREIPPLPKEAPSSRRGKLFSLPPAPPLPEEALSLGDAIVKRRSRRRYLREPLSLEMLSSLLRASFSGYRADYLPPGMPAILKGELIVHRVEGFTQGLYSLGAEDLSLEFLEEGDLSRSVISACMGQTFCGEASLVLALVADLKRLRAPFGERGYRYALLEAGLLGQRVYLAAEALGLGACGVGAFYDREVAELLRLGKGEVPLYLLTVGPPVD